MPARVLVAHPFPDLYGADRMLLQALRGLARAGEVVIVAPEPGPLLATLSGAGYRFRVSPFPVLRRAVLSPGPLLRMGVGLPLHLARLRRLLREERADLLYVNTLTLPHWLLAGKLAGLPVVCHVHEAPENLSRQVTRVLTAPLKLAARVVANSEATARYVTHAHPALAHRTTVVANGLDFPVAPRMGGPGPGARAASTGAVKPRPGPVRLLVAGRLSPTKGQDVALRAVAHLVREGHDVELDVVGSTFRGYEWFEGELRQQAKALGIGGRVRFHGFRHPLWETYRSSDVVLVPSRSESFGNVAVEAMAMARPVVASRVGGLPFIIEDGRTGLLCEPEDGVGMAAAVARLLDDISAASRMGLDGCAEVRRRFCSSRFERELLDVVDGLLTGVRPEGRRHDEKTGRRSRAC